MNAPICFWALQSPMAISRTAAHLCNVKQKRKRGRREKRKNGEKTKREKKRQRETILLDLNHAFYFHGIFWRLFECIFGLYSDLRWPASEQVSASPFKKEHGANSPTVQRDGSLCWPGPSDPNRQPGVGCTQQPTPSPTALLRAQTINKGEKMTKVRVYSMFNCLQR